MSKYMPGPFHLVWQVDCMGKTGRVIEDEKHNRPLGNLGFAEDDKVGDLFAAAPDMLEALEACRSKLVAYGYEHCDAETKATAAIAKARGRS